MRWQKKLEIVLLEDPVTRKLNIVFKLPPQELKLQREDDNHITVLNMIYALQKQDDQITYNTIYETYELVDLSYDQLSLQVKRWNSLGKLLDQQDVKDGVKNDGPFELLQEGFENLKQAEAVAVNNLQERLDLDVRYLTDLLELKQNFLDGIIQVDFFRQNTEQLKVSYEDKRKVLDEAYQLNHDAINHATFGKKINAKLVEMRKALDAEFETQAKRLTSIDVDDKTNQEANKKAVSSMLLEIKNRRKECTDRKSVV